MTKEQKRKRNGQDPIFPFKDMPPTMQKTLLVPLSERIYHFPTTVPNWEPGVYNRGLWGGTYENGSIPLTP